MVSKLAFWLGVGISTGAEIEAGHAMNTTMYHINPVWAGVVPGDEDTGDLDGILYFFLDTLFLPLECANGGGMSGFDCSNPERTDPDMVHTLVEMEHDDRFTGYSLCNLCTDGTDKISHKSCTIGEYQCNCGMGGSCDPKYVGRESIPGGGSPRRRAGPGPTPSPGPPSPSPFPFPDFGRRRSSNYADTFDAQNTFDAQAEAERGCTAGQEWSCYKSKLGKKTGGYWYSPPKSAMCSDEVGETCGWRVSSMFTVNDTCVRESVYEAVEVQGPDCFAGCGPRNVTTACWINCFFGTFLGESAGQSNAPWDETMGMNMSDVHAGYLNAFRPESEGGCPWIEVNTTSNDVLIM